MLLDRSGYFVQFSKVFIVQIYHLFSWEIEFVFFSEIHDVPLCVFSMTQKSVHKSGFVNKSGVHKLEDVLLFIISVHNLWIATVSVSVSWDLRPLIKRSKKSNFGLGQIYFWNKLRLSVALSMRKSKSYHKINILLRAFLFKFRNQNLIVGPYSKILTGTNLLNFVWIAIHVSKGEHL